jgi:hypothetical protein
MICTSVVFRMIPTSRLTSGGISRRRGLVLLARDRLHRSARRLGDLGAAPERQGDDPRRQRAELEAGPEQRRQAEVDDEEGHDHGEPAPDLDVEADQPARGRELDRQQRAEHDADHRGEDQRERRHAQRVPEPGLEHVPRDGLDPVGQHD